MIADRLKGWSQGLAWLALLCLAGAMFVTLADIGLRAVSRAIGLVAGRTPGLALVGIVDLVQLAVMAAAYLAIPYTFAGEGHVTVDILHLRLPRRLQQLLRALGALLSCLFMAMILGFGIEQARLVAAYGDRSATLGIPLVWYWLPLLAGAALSVLITALQAASLLLRVFETRH